jgi:hypothetical protein
VSNLANFGTGVFKELDRMAPPHQVIMLKFIKNLSMLSATLDTLQNSNAIEALTNLLDKGRTAPHFKEISNQVLNTMYNLCRLSKSRQEEAAMNGIIPVLQNIVKTERPLKEFALPILCDMAHSSKRCRGLLWQNNSLEFYISLLSDPYWQVTALDAILVWLQEETAMVEEKLLSPSSITAIIKCFTTSKTHDFENILEPLQKLLRSSLLIAHAVGRPEFFARILQKLSHNKAVVRLNLLRVLRTICDASDQKEGLIRQYDMYPMVQRVADKDGAVLVRNMASDLIKACNERVKGSIRNQRRRSHAPSTGSSFPAINPRRPRSSMWNDSASDLSNPPVLQRGDSAGSTGSNSSTRSNRSSRSVGSTGSNGHPPVGSMAPPPPPPPRTPRTPRRSRAVISSAGTPSRSHTSSSSSSLMSLHEAERQPPAHSQQQPLQPPPPPPPLSPGTPRLRLQRSTTSVGNANRFRAANNYVPRRHRGSDNAGNTSSPAADGNDLKNWEWH